jgi:hypothetical protein
MRRYRFSFVISSYPLIDRIVSACSVARRTDYISHNLFLPRGRKIARAIAATTLAGRQRPRALGRNRAIARGITERYKSLAYSRVGILQSCLRSD